MTRHTLNLLKSFAALALVAAMSACLPPTKSLKATSAATATDLSSLGLDTASDGAKAPCTRYDTSTATRSICVSCYQSILSTRCPGKAEFASCLDTTVKTGYVTLVNQCVSQSTQAGFTCTTTCGAGLVINPTNCTCVAAPPVSGSGSTTVDVGQTDFGPPIIRASIPSASIVGTFVSATNSCEGTLPLYMGVQNRGDTVFRLNSYSTPTVYASDNAGSVPYLSNASQPVIMTTTETAEHPGTNIKASVKFATGGTAEVTAATGGRVGAIATVSGAGSDGTTFSDGVTNGGAGPGSSVSDLTGSSVANVTWSSPGFSTRDSMGNIYVSDPLAHVVDVICYNPTALGSGLGSPFCEGVTQGNVVRIAGLAGYAGYETDITIPPDDIEDPVEGAPGYMAKLNSPHGLAVDSNFDVYIADSGNNRIRVVYSADWSIWTQNVTGGVIPIGNLNFPYGVDVSATKLFVADYQNHRVIECDSGIVGGNCVVKVGNRLTGAQGYQPDGVATDNADWMRYPTDVKVNWHGNVLYTDSRNHLIRGICYATGKGDFCNASAIGNVVTVAGLPPVPPNSTGVPRAGDSGEGVGANLGLITYPTQLLIAKQFADDTVDGPGGGQSGTQMFRDNNIVFTEKLLGATLLNGIPEPSTIKNGSGTLNGISNMYMGVNHTCFVEATGGAIKCVGNNTVNQIGSSTASNPQSTPKENGVDISGSLWIGGGTNHTCSISSDGVTMHCWGYNGSGQLGNATTVTQTEPVTVETSAAGTPNWNYVVGGDSHTCAINLSGAVSILCWGNNASGQLGRGNDNFTSLTQPTTGAGNIALISTVTGGFTALQSITASGNFTCMTYTEPGGDYSIACWGDDSNGQLGNNGNKQEFADDPVVNSAGAQLKLNNIPSIKAAGNHVCAWDPGGTDLYCWGSNSKGELGIGTTSNSENRAQQVTVTGNLIQGTSDSSLGAVALGIAHTCYANDSNQVYCWGDNSSGQLGNDDVPNSTVPLQVVGLPSGTVLGIFAQGNQTCALFNTTSASGTPYCWGNNQNKQLGTPTISTATSSGNVVRIICGDNSSTAAITAGDIRTAGFCTGVPAPTLAAGVTSVTTAQGNLYTIAGKSGKAGNRGTGDGGNARAASFGKAVGLTYDLYKNIIVSSGGFKDSAGSDHIDFSLRRIANVAVGPSSGVKYTVTDSNNLSSYWCLRLKAATVCDSVGSCSCAMLPPTDDTADPEFWKAIASGGACQ